MQIKYLFFIYDIFIYICFMISNTTIRLNDKIKKAGQDKAKENAVRGGFSAYVEQLIQDDVMGYTFTLKQIHELQSEVHAITGNGKVMQCFNALLGVAAGG